MIDFGDADVAVGDDVVLIGEQDGPDGSQRIRAEHWAELLDTIGYEIVCGIGGHVPRRHSRSIESDMLGRRRCLNFVQPRWSTRTPSPPSSHD